MPKPVRVVRDFINRHICLSDQREIPVFFTRTIHPPSIGVGRVLTRLGGDRGLRLPSASHVRSCETSAYRRRGFR